MMPNIFTFNNRLLGRYSRALYRKYSTTGILPSAMSDIELRRILQQVSEGKLSLSESEYLIRRQSGKELLSSTSTSTSSASPEELLKSFADLDHTRSSRTAFPEAVFGPGKTPNQIALILDDMARHFNDKVLESDGKIDSSQRAILATRISSDMYESVKGIPLSHGHLVYHPVANILSIIPSCLASSKIVNEDSMQLRKRIIVATAGTTDLPVAEEAAVVLEAANCKVERIYDVGVAGLHRVIRALPRLQSNEVGCVIVCAGMDGALPSVVGGLVSVPVIAVPTSIGYGVSLGGISALMTMLNSCAPGVGVVNIDNGFGAAALAYKCIL